MPPTSPRRGTLSDYLASEDIVAFTPLSDADWNDVRADATRIMLRQFCTLRNLWVHRGTYILDMLGYAWAGIYRSLLVGSIVTTSYRNEGHIRAGDRIFGTHDTTDRLIGAILLHALDSSRGTEPLFKQRTIELAAGEPLIR